MPLNQDLSTPPNRRLFAQPSKPSDTFRIESANGITRPIPFGTRDDEVIAIVAKDINEEYDPARFVSMASRETEDGWIFTFVK